MPEPITCQSIADPLARAICERLGEDYQIEPATLDQGTLENRFQGEVIVTELVGAGDGDLTPELYERALAICGEEYRQGNTTFCRFLAQQMPLPLVPDDFDGATLEDAVLRAEVARLITSLPSPSPRELYRRLVGAPAEGGMGIALDPSESSPVRSLADVYRERRAVCIEFVDLFLMIADQAGISVVPIERYQSEVPHLAIGILGEGGVLAWAIDIQRERGNLEGFYQPRSEERIAPITRSLLHGYHYTALAMREADRTLAESFIDRGLLLGPRNYLLLTNKAYFLHLGYLETGDGNLLESARALLLEAQQQNPHYHRIARNLGRIERLSPTGASGDRSTPSPPGVPPPIPLEDRETPGNHKGPRK